LSDSTPEKKGRNPTQLALLVAFPRYNFPMRLAAHGRSVGVQDTHGGNAATEMFAIMKSCR
jgi:hypothetical protein